MRRIVITYRPIGEIKPHPRNARTHSDAQVNQIALSIVTFGFTNPILVNEQLQIIAGHGRLEAARQLELAEVPVIQLTGLSDAQQRALMLADNKIALNAGWNEQIVFEELNYLESPEVEFDIEVTGFSTPEIDQIIGLPDEPVEDPVDKVPAIDRSQPATTATGDVWLLGQHRMICADALNEATYAALMQGEKAQQVITDPPYNVPVDGHVSGLGKTTHAEFAMAAGEMSPQEFIAFLIKVFLLMVANIVDGAIVMGFMDWRHIGEMLKAGEEAFTALKSICVWNKTNAGMGSLYRSQHELVFVWKYGHKPHVNNVELGKHGRYRTNVWTYAGANAFRRGRKEDLETHPTVKPIAMIMDAIKDCSDRNGLILDPFGGSGTTLLAAERTGRRARLIEIDPYYVDATIARFEKLTKASARLEGTDETFAAVKQRRRKERSGGAGTEDAA